MCFARRLSVVLIACLPFLFVSVSASAQVARRPPRAKALPAPKPDRRLTLLLQVVSVPVVGQAMVQATSSATIERPLDLVDPFLLSLTRKTKFHFSTVHPVPFIAGETLVVRTDLFGSAPSLQGLAREVWEIPLYEAEQRLRKDTVIGTVVQGLTGNSLQGTLIVAREDGTRAVYRVTPKSRFCQGDVQVLPAVYQAGMPIAVKPRSLPGGGVMASIVAESQVGLDRAYRDTLTVWHGILERAEVGAFFLILRRDDGVRRKVRFPSVIKIVTVAEEKKRIPDRVYQFSEIIEKPIIVHLVRGERPDPDGTRTATRIILNLPKDQSGGLSQVPPDIAPLQND
jgi:hypothetical protein